MKQMQESVVKLAFGELSKTGFITLCMTARVTLFLLHDEIYQTENCSFQLEIH